MSNRIFTINLWTGLKRLVLNFDSETDAGVVSIDEIGLYLTFLRLSPKLKLTLRGDFTVRTSLEIILCIQSFLYPILI